MTARTCGNPADVRLLAQVLEEDPEIRYQAAVFSPKLAELQPLIRNAEPARYRDDPTLTIEHVVVGSDRDLVQLIADGIAVDKAEVVHTDRWTTVALVYSHHPNSMIRPTPLLPSAVGLDETQELLAKFLNGPSFE